MIFKSDCKLPPPKVYPGWYTKNNRSGTVLSMPEWYRGEAKRWFEEMKDNEKYDATYFSIKADCLKSWLLKSFPKISINEAKTILFEIEENSEDNHNVDDMGNTEDSCGYGDMVVDLQDRDQDLMETDPVIQQDSLDMFASDEEIVEDIEMNRTDKDRIIKQCCENMSETSLVNESGLPDFVKHSRLYKGKRDEFVRQFIDQTFEVSSSQEIVCGFTQLPSFVKEHQYLQEKLSHKSKEEMSSLRALKNLEGVCNDLKKDPSQEAYNLRVILTSSIICPRYGVPKIDETDSVIRAAKKVKKAFCTGEESILRVGGRKKRSVYPTEVNEMAIESWELDGTTVEPNQHSRPETALKDGSDTVPNRLQVLTDDEAYAEFKDKYEEKVKAAMKTQCDSVKEKYKFKPESVSKDRVMKILQRKQELFPSKKWFVQRKPPQTKINNDHSTGLCKDCHANHLNYERLHKFCKKFCHCKTDKCPNWVCFCEEDPEDCHCSHECDCDDCISCQVRY